MDFVILDLEWNSSYSRKMKKYINEIFEFGAVRVNDKMEIVDTFSMLIKPQIGKKICDRVKRLTHIDTEELSESNNTYNHVVKLFNSFSRNAVVMTWGVTDIQTLISNNEYYNKNRTLSFLNEYINLQSYCEMCLKREDASKQMGLAAAAELLNLEFDGNSLHNALDDSMLAYKCLKELYDPDKIKNFVKKADADFYNRICFKNIFICDNENPLIDKKQLYAVCPVCGVKGRRLNCWQMKNKAFRAAFYCDFCRIKFEGRVQFKLKYEGMQVRRSSYRRDNAENHKHKVQEESL